jgi:hypothetical protein
VTVRKRLAASPGKNPGQRELTSTLGYGGFLQSPDRRDA